GNDTVTNYGAVQAGNAIMHLLTGNDTVNNYGNLQSGPSSTYDADGIWCSPDVGQTCTINNYSGGTIHSTSGEAIDLENPADLANPGGIGSQPGGTLNVYNEGTISSDYQEAMHLIGITRNITNKGTIRGDHQAIDNDGPGTLTINNYGAIISGHQEAI